MATGDLPGPAAAPNSQLGAEARQGVALLVDAELLAQLPAGERRAAPGPAPPGGAPAARPEGWVRSAAATRGANHAATAQPDHRRGRGIDWCASCAPMRSGAFSAAGSSGPRWAIVERLPHENLIDENACVFRW
jgi:hypothetical protein